MRDTESIVYGCIRDTVYHAGQEQARQRRAVNRAVLASLPSIEDWPLLAREMFAAPIEVVEYGAMHTDVMHFGSAYRSVEYEWDHWLSSFEAMLQRMYWVAATVHLETEFNGRHTFTWEAEGDDHQPSESRLAMRCEWVREGLAL